MAEDFWAKYFRTMTEEYQAWWDAMDTPEQHARERWGVLSTEVDDV